MTTSVAPTIAEDVVRESMAVRWKNKLPELPEFNGKRAEFKPWLTQIRAKLLVDKKDETETVRF